MINNNFDLYLHFETYFKNNCIHFIQNDIYTDENEIKFINYDKFKKLLNLNEFKYNTKYFNGIEYLSISNCIDCIKTKNNYETINFGIYLGFYGFQKFRDYKLIYIINNEIETKSQFLFEYSITDLIKNKYPNIKISREINILEKFNIPHIEKKNNLFRYDILLDICDIIIEYDEGHHKNPKQKKIDKDKDIISNYLGYDILRCSKTNLKESNIISFLETLDDKIKENLLRDEPKNFKDYIVYFFKNKMNIDINEQEIRLYTDEICEDIMNGCEYDKIGRQIKSLSLREYIIPYLDIKYDDIDSEKEIENIIDLIENCDEPYEKRNNDYILSSRAFELVIMSLDENIYEKSKIIKKVLQEIKIQFQKYLYDSNLKNIQQKNERRQFIPDVINIGVEAGKLENYESVNQMEKKNRKLEAENKELQLRLKEFLPHNKRGIIKEELICIDKNLVNGEPIVPEIPQLVYCETECIIMNETLKAKFNLNKSKSKIKKSYNEVINDIFEKLGIIRHNKNSYYQNMIFNAMYIEDYNEKYENSDNSFNTDTNTDTNTDSDSINFDLDDDDDIFLY